VTSPGCCRAVSARVGLLSLLEVGSNGYGELTVMVGPPSARDLETGCVVSGGVGAFGEADAVPARGPVRSGPVRSGPVAALEGLGGAGGRSGPAGWIVRRCPR
jgi:hypothetical protein